MPLPFGVWIRICTRAGLNWGQKGTQKGSKRESREGTSAMGGGRIFNFCSWSLLILNIVFIGSADLLEYRRNIYYFVGFMYKSEFCKLEITKTNFGTNFEAPKKRCRSGTRSKILPCDDRIETSPLLPRRRAYPRRRKSSTKT